MTEPDAADPAEDAPLTAWDYCCYLLLAYAFPLMLLVAGVAFVSVGVWSIINCVAAQGWPTTAGRVRVSRVNVEKRYTVRRGFHEVSDAAVSYAYMVGGGRYTCDRITYAALNRSGTADATAVAERYPAGAPVTVHYNPADPSDAVLEVSITVWCWVAVALGVAVFAGGAWWLKNLTWGGRERTPPNEKLPAAERLWEGD